MHDMATDLPTPLSKRRDFTVAKLVELREGLPANIAVEANPMDEDSTSDGYQGCCIFATGSVGREEACEHSDLDVFIVDGALSSAPLSRLAHYELVASLIRVSRQSKFRRFSRDGKFLTSHCVDEILGQLGRPEDDYNNRFTARMLLLLESKWIYGEEAYDSIIRSIIERYWPADQQAEPIFLLNDLVRFWKTLCLNYEGYSRQHPSDGERRLDLLKLRYSRLWTCFSGIAYLLAGLQGELISRERVSSMTTLTPLERMRNVAERREQTKDRVHTLVELYSEFLAATDKPSAESHAALEDSAAYVDMKCASERFGNEFHALVIQLSAESQIQRYLLV
jgi:hypothetical protein